MNKNLHNKQTQILGDIQMCIITVYVFSAQFRMIRLILGVQLFAEEHLVDLHLNFTFTKW